MTQNENNGLKPPVSSRPPASKDAHPQAGPEAPLGKPGMQGGGQQQRPGPGPQGPGGPHGPGKPGGPGLAPVVEIRPIAETARMRRRHWGLLVSFVAIVLAPLTGVMLYLWLISADQYSSTAGFTVRQEESNSASDLLGGLNLFAGSGGSSDSDVLYEFIQSQDLVQRIDARVDLRGHYSQHWPGDPIFSIWPDASIEDLVWFWQRMVRISYDQASSLIELQVIAFDPETAQRIASEIVTESQDMINALNEQARADAMRYAQTDLDEALMRLKEARQALTSFRTRTRIVDPAADMQGRMGVMNNLQQQLATALIELDFLSLSARSTDPRIVQAHQRIDVIRDRIARERETFATDSTEGGGVGEDYPNLIAEFESLTVDLEYAEQSYRASLTALDAARASAVRQSRYLAAYVKPTLAQTSEFPQRFVMAALAAVFLLLLWSILTLVYYSIRDRR